MEQIRVPITELPNTLRMRLEELRPHVPEHDEIDV